MKKLVLTLTATLVCLGAFAQGKVSFQNDSTRLAFFNPSDPTYGGQAVYAGNGPAGVNFMADLYMGTSAGVLQLVSSTTFGGVPGKWNSTSVLAPFPGGTTVFVEVQIRDSTTPASPIFNAAGPNNGISPEFTFLLGNSITYPTLLGANGNWPVGNFNMDAYGVGARGSVQVTPNPVPEPATFALAGLGAAALLIFRRRK